MNFCSKRWLHLIIYSYDGVIAFFRPSVNQLCQCRAALGSPIQYATLEHLSWNNLRVMDKESLWVCGCLHYAYSN